MSAPKTVSKSRRAWAIKFVGSPLDNYQAWFAGEPTPVGAKLYKTRQEARVALRGYRAETLWAFVGPWAYREGGRRIYKCATVVPVRLDIREILSGEATL